MPDAVLKEDGNEHLFVTFVLFAYNQEKFIRAAVEGALSQTYSPMEIILSDDCSTDRTFEIMQEIASEYTGKHNVIVRQNTSNLGLENHINIVWGLAKGQWIVVAAGDDISEPYRVSKIIKTIEKYPGITAISSAFTLINSDGEITGNEHMFDNDKQEVTLWNIRDVMDGIAPPVHGATAAYSKELLTDFSLLPEKSVYEDAILSFRSVLIGQRAYINKNLVRYRNHENQTTNIVTKNIIENDKKRVKKFYGSYITSMQYLDDYYQVFSSKDNDSIKKWIIQRILVNKYQYLAISWVWPFRIIPYLFLKFYNEQKNTLSRDTKAKILLPKPVYTFSKQYKGNK